jgi:hypothetical protein
MTEFPDSEEQNRDFSKHVKTSTAPSTGKGNDLMAAAMAMQKEREKGDGNGNPKATDNLVTTRRPI